MLCVLMCAREEEGLYVLYVLIYCILRGRIKGFNRSITTILCQVGSYRTVVG